MEFIIQKLISDYPFLLKVLVFMALARSIFKPLCAAVNKYVEESESLKDNELWKKVQENKVFKAFAFVLDYTASIKLPK